MSVTSYLQWLARRDKDLPLPLVRAVDHWDAAGSYFSPYSIAPDEWRRTVSKEYVDLWDRRIVWTPDGDLVSFARGLIIINPNAAKNDFGEIEVAATIAHEWRHHWQAFNWGRSTAVEVDNRIPHKESMVKYFSASRFEADALRFELQHVPSEVNLERASWLGWPTRQRTYLLP